MVTGHEVIAVHLAIMHEAVCHECGWSSGPLDTQGAAERAADEHAAATRADTLDIDVPLTDRG